MVRVPDPHLSLWQAAVREAAATEHAGGDIAAEAARADPMLRATHGGRPAAEDDERVRLMAVGFELAKAEAAGDQRQAQRLRDQVRAFSGEDPRFVLECVAVFVAYYKLRGREATYRDWRDHGGLGFGVIERRLPDDATIALLGDWGTGQDDAAELLVDILRAHRPTALVHLGDIYYAGTRKECQRNFRDVLRRAFDDVLGPGQSIPVFNLPGNHDYYSGGEGYYWLLDSLNEPRWRQPASYFCLRTEDGAWQLLGMDTGLGDHDPASAINRSHVGPGLQASEVEWLHDKLRGFDGATILLSHHQLFSAGSRINGTNSGRSAYLNSALYRVVQPYMDRVAAWFWGHEHSLGIFRDGLLGLARGRLVGCSAYEVGAGEGAPSLHAVPYAEPAVRLGIRGSWLDHGYAILELDRTATADPIRASYYQFPSWGDEIPNDRVGSLLHVEPLARPERVPARPWETPLPGASGVVSLATDGERVFAGSGGRVYRLDPATGSIADTAELPVGGAELRLALSGSRLVAASSDGQVFGRDASNLEHGWGPVSPPGWGGVTGLLADRGRVFLGSQGYAHRLDPDTGALAGESGGLTGTLYGEVRLGAAGDLLFAGINGFALALGADDLLVRWKTLESLGWTVTSVLAAGVNLFVGVGGRVVALRAADGEEIARPPLGQDGEGEVRLAAHDELVLVGWAGRLAALRAADAAIIWPSLELADCGRGVVDVAAGGGRVAVGCGGYLYLFEADGALRSVQDLTAHGRGEVRVAVAGARVLAGLGGAVVAVEERLV